MVTYRAFAIVGIVALLVALMPSGAIAAGSTEGPQSPQPPNELVQLLEQLTAAGDKSPELYSSLKPEQQELLRAYTEVATVESGAFDTPAPFAPLADASGRAPLGCSTYTAYRWAKNSLGQYLWKYFESVYRCWNGSYVYNISRNRWGEVYGLMWYFRGHTGSSTRGGNNQWSYYAWTQGHFELCVLWVGCGAQNRYPWVEITVYGNGSASYKTGG